MTPQHTVDQHKTIAKIRKDESLPQPVRFPSLEHMREQVRGGAPQQLIARTAGAVGQEHSVRRRGKAGDG
jgi:hypothetical protein